jgi:hypothetical protein
LKPGPTRLVDPGPGWPGAGTEPSLRKNRGSYDQGWPDRLTWQDPVKNLVVTRWLIFFCFFTKTTLFWVKKKNWSNDPLKTHDPAGSTTRPGFKTLVQPRIHVTKNILVPSFPSSFHCNHFSFFRYFILIYNFIFQSSDGEERKLPKNSKWEKEKSVDHISILKKILMLMSFI